MAVTTRPRSYQRRELVVRARLCLATTLIRAGREASWAQPGQIIVAVPPEKPTHEYAIAADLFERIYEPLPGEDGVYRSRPITVSAYMALQPLALRTSQGQEWARPTDFVVTDPDGTVRVVPRTVFESRYQRLHAES